MPQQRPTSNRRVTTPRNDQPPTSEGRSNGFWPIPWDTILKEGLCVCRTCGALVIDSERSTSIHKEFHR